MKRSRDHAPTEPLASPSELEAFGLWFRFTFKGCYRALIETARRIVLDTEDAESIVEKACVQLLVLCTGGRAERRHTGFRYVPEPREKMLALNIWDPRQRERLRVWMLQAVRLLAETAREDNRWYEHEYALLDLDELRYTPLGDPPAWDPASLRLQNMMLALPADQSFALTMKYDSYSVREIAAAMGIPQRTVRNHLALAESTLASMIRRSKLRITARSAARSRPPGRSEDYHATSLPEGAEAPQKDHHGHEAGTDPGSRRRLGESSGRSRAPQGLRLLPKPCRRGPDPLRQPPA